MVVKRLVLEKADRLYHTPLFLDDFLPGIGRQKLVRRDIIDLARLHWPQLQGNIASDPSPHRAAEEGDLKALAEATAVWYQTRYGITVNPRKEIFIGKSIRQILSLFTLAFLNPGDMFLIPDPGIWHYRAAAALASAETVPYHLTERNNYRPAVGSLSTSLTRLSKAMIINTPHNPTGQILTRENLGELLHLAGRENLILVLDQAFNEYIDSDQPASLYGLPGGRKVALELYSYAYNLGQSGLSLSFAVGQPALIAGLRQTARSFGLTVTLGEAKLAAIALERHRANTGALNRYFAENRKYADQLCHALRLYPPEHRNGPFYWAKLPGRKQSRRFARHLFLRSGLILAPGIAFGENGEGYLRFSLTPAADQYQKAIAAASKIVPGEG